MDNLQERIRNVLDLDGVPYQARYDAAAQLIRDMQARIAELENEAQSADEQLKALSNKLGDNCCACSYDKDSDVCAVHAPKVKQLEAENAKLREAQEWKDISSAPKMGKVLLWHKDVYKIPHIGWYNHPSNEWELIELFKDKKEPYIAPTHWMPLPESPKE